MDETNRVVELVRRECARAFEDDAPPERLVERIATGCFRIGAQAAAFDIEMKVRRAGGLLTIELDESIFDGLPGEGGRVSDV
jgi:hypothetical protein